MFLLCFACHQLLCVFLSLLLTFPIFIISPEYSPLPTVVHLSMAQISPSPSTTPTLSDPPGHETQKSALDFNVMVVGAAMLCALVCALGLNSTLRCAFQCMRRALAETAQWAVSRRVNSGLKKKEMLALPTSTYANQESPSRASGCAICLADFTEGDKIRVLPKCNHRFHVLCIDKWLLSHSSCPTCRHWLKSSDSIDQLAAAL